MKTKFANLAMIVFIVGTVGFTDSDAAVYKWRDENGKVFFTDDPSKVPEEFRKKPLIKDFKTSNTTNKPSLATDKKNAKEDSSEPEKKEDGKSEGLTEAHRSTIQTAIGFLKEDISRYEKFYTWPASVRKFHHIKLAVAGVTPQKQDLSEQVKQHDLPLFGEIAGFLQSSLAEDKKVLKIPSTTPTFVRQTQALISRLKSDTVQEIQLLEKLTVALTEDDAAKAQSKTEQK